MSKPVWVLDYTPKLPDEPPVASAKPLPNLVISSGRPTLGAFILATVRFCYGSKSQPGSRPLIAVTILPGRTVVVGNSFVADLVVSGPGTAGGTLHVEGTFLNPGPVGKFKVQVVLGSKRAAVLVPDA